MTNKLLSCLIAGVLGTALALSSPAFASEAACTAAGEAECAAWEAECISAR